MKYQYAYKNNAHEFWQLSMYQIYGSIVGVCNIIFTVAMVGLMMRKWDDFNIYLRIFLILLLFWFPLIQPLLIYSKSKKQEAAITDYTEVSFNEKGINAKLGNQSSFIPWKKIVKISKKPTMIIIFTDDKYGYLLTNRILGGDKESFYKFVSSKVEN